MHKSNPVIEFRKVAVSFHDSGPVLQNLDWRVDPGEKVAIAGPTGEGKTTIFRLIRALLIPCFGSVRVFGSPLRYGGRHLRTLWTHIPVVDQDAATLLPYLSILQNVMKPLLLQGNSGRQARRVATDLLKRVGLGDLLQARPDNVSGGERQRAVIARALAMDGRIILADEPTAALDAPTARPILELLGELEQTVVLITHQPTWVLPFVDRLLVLYHGRLHDITDGARRHPERFSTFDDYRDLLEMAAPARDDRQHLRADDLTHVAGTPYTVETPHATSNHLSGLYR